MSSVIDKADLYRMATELANFVKEYDRDFATQANSVASYVQEITPQLVYDYRDSEIEHSVAVRNYVRGIHDAKPTAEAKQAALYAKEVAQYVRVMDETTVKIWYREVSA